MMFITIPASFSGWFESGYIHLSVCQSKVCAKCRMCYITKTFGYELPNHVPHVPILGYTKGLN